MVSSYQHDHRHPDGGFSRAAAPANGKTSFRPKVFDITAVYAHNDEMALGAIQALKSGYEARQDVIVPVSIGGRKLRRGDYPRRA